MPKLFTLSCPSCGAKLKVSNNLERFTCEHCGNEHLVKDERGTIYLLPIIKQLRAVGEGVDRTASELAIKRLRSEISSLTFHRDMIETSPGCLSTLFSSYITWIPVLSGAFIGATFFIFSLIVNIDSIANVSCGVLIIIIPSITLIVDYNLRKGIKKDRETTKEQYTKLIREKNSELQYHENIVKTEPITQPRKR
ncbi:MAG: hypothetical protein Q8L68_06155 [Methylococcales bacterium]|nr:hypothetical protein [Methylococcales bacterium]